MLFKIRKGFTITSVIMTAALVFAMTGGAYAASKYLITSTKQISPKVLKSLKGSNGKIGPAGPAGPAGATGLAGAAGAKGETGSTGKEGPAGKEGPVGKEGSPWTAAGTLPKGESLKGEWSASAPSGAAINSVSFALPLATAPTVHYIRMGESAPAGCSGEVENPGAEEGNLCVFASIEENSLDEFFSQPLPTTCAWEGGASSGCFPAQASKFGFGIEAIAETDAPVKVAGTWAVTAAGS
jgi:Collagen triple helix repeat (20 copies)